MRVLFLALLISASAIVSAQAHGLKISAALEGDTLHGYAYFVGGGRPEGARVVIHNAAGAEEFRGTTDRDGEFSWKPPILGIWTVVVDTREGHMATFTPGIDSAEEENIRLKDVIGGIGIVVGLAGIAMWLSVRQRRNRDQ